MAIDPQAHQGHAPTTIRRAVVKAYDAPSNTATVQLTGSLPSYLAGVPVATDIAAALMVAGARVGLVFFDDANPTDACVAFVY